jgi:hypothetical protein
MSCVIALSDDMGPRIANMYIRTQDESRAGSLDVAKVAVYGCRQRPATRKSRHFEEARSEDERGGIL